MNRFLAAIARQIEERPGDVFCHFIARDDERAISWGELSAGIGGFAAAYRARRLAPGGAVLIFLRHDPALYASFLGAMMGGLVPAFMPCASPRQDPRIYWESHRALLRRIAPAAIVLDRKTLGEMRQAGLPVDHYPIIQIEDVAAARIEVRPAVSEDAIALLQHSSGTTGLKKGVALTYRAIAEQLDSYGDAIRLTPADRIVSWLPLYHDMGLVACFLLPAYSGIPFIHLDALQWVARPELFFAAIERHRGTLGWLPNFAFDHLAQRVDRARRFDLSSMRAFIDCSEPCRPDTFERYLDKFGLWGVKPEALQSCYAMAETVFCVSQTPLGARWREREIEGRARMMDLGPPVSGIELSVRDRDGNALREGAVGEIALQGRFLFDGYFGDPALTAERIRDGWYYTRDLGCVIAGEVYILGRADDVLIVNGRNLHAREIEALIDTLGCTKPGRVAAFTHYDESTKSTGLIVVAEKNPATQLDEDRIVATIAAHIRSTVDIQPRDIYIAPPGWVVKTTSGKIARGDNRRKYLAARQAEGLQLA